MPIKVDNKKPFVSNMYCSPNQQVLMVRRRPHVVTGGGFVVMDCNQRHTVFRVDGCRILGAKETLVLRDGCGDALLLIRRKEGVVEALSLHRRSWTGYKVEYEVPQELVFSLKDPNTCLGTCNTIRITSAAQHKIVSSCSSSWDFEIKGSFADKDCSMVDRRGNVVAQIGPNHNTENLRLTSDDLYHVTVMPGIDQAFVFGVIAVLDYVYGECTRC